MEKLQSSDGMEAGIYSTVRIPSFRNIQITIIVYMLNKEERTNLLSKSKTKVP